MAHALPPRNAPRPRVAVLMLTATTFARRVLDGVAAYARDHAPWQLQTGPHVGFEPIIDLGRWRGDAVIATLSTPQRAEEVLALGLPTVNISSARERFGVPAVWSDNRGVGRAAAQHLLDCGFQHFAYAGETDKVYSEDRFAGFAERLADQHAQPHAIHAPQRVLDKDYLWNDHFDRMVDFLRQLPQPCGVLACDDYHANLVMQACHAADLHVPDQIGVVGVNNDDLICSMTDPPLSSIPLAGAEIGRTAAQLVDRMLKGEPVPPRVHYIPHRPVAARGSTDVLHFQHPAVQVAVRRIRLDAGSRPLTVAQLADEAAVSRRVLLEHFTREVGRSPSYEIARVRLARLEDLLARTDWSIKRVAQTMRFESPADLARFFRRHHDTTPTAFRRDAGPEGSIDAPPE